MGKGINLSDSSHTDTFRGSDMLRNWVEKVVKARHRLQLTLYSNYEIYNEVITTFRQQE